MRKGSVAVLAALLVVSGAFFSVTPSRGGAATPSVNVRCLGQSAHGVTSGWLNSDSSSGGYGGQDVLYDTGVSGPGTPGDATRAKRYAAWFGHGFGQAFVERIHKTSRQGCPYDIATTLFTPAGALAHVRTAQLGGPLAISNLLFINRTVAAPRGFVAFAVGKMNGFVAVAGVTSTGLLVSADVASAGGAAALSGWPTTTFNPNPIPIRSAPLNTEQLTQLAQKVLTLLR
jgi:hypothetical protein